jgi:hypothetical protein
MRFLWFGNNEKGFVHFEHRYQYLSSQYSSLTSHIIQEIEIPKIQWNTVSHGGRNQQTRAVLSCWHSEPTWFRISHEIESSETKKLVFLEWGNFWTFSSPCEMTLTKLRGKLCCWVELRQTSTTHQQLVFSILLFRVHFWGHERWIKRSMRGSLIDRPL